MLEELISFLRSDLDISLEAISLAVKTKNLEPNYPVNRFVAVWFFGSTAARTGLYLVRSLLS